MTNIYIPSGNVLYAYKPILNPGLMHIQNFEIDTESAIQSIKSKYNPVMVQAPEGLKRYLPEIANELRRTNAEVIISASPCYGACDIADYEAKQCGARALIHIGHTEIPCLAGKYLLPVIFVEARSLLDIASAVEKAAVQIKNQGISKIGLITTAQHLWKIEEAKKILESNGIEIIIGKGDRRISGPIVFGCNFSSARAAGNAGAEAYLFIGTGNFHPLGVSISTKKPVFIADPERNEVRIIEKMRDEILKKRYVTIARAMDAKRFGIIVGTKIGQCRMPLAQNIRRRIEVSGRCAELISMNTVDPSYIEYLPFDAYVCTACPRIAIEDQVRFKKPVLTPVELEIALGKRGFEEYVFDEILEG